MIASSIGFKSSRVYSVILYEKIQPIKKKLLKMVSKSNSSRTIPSWERKLEIDFIPSTVIPQPER